MSNMINGFLDDMSVKEYAKGLLDALYDDLFENRGVGMDSDNEDEEVERVAKEVLKEALAQLEK